MKYKHKKTRKQKIIADFNRQLYSLENKNIYSSKNITSVTTTHNGTHSYAYVLRDVSKTLILTLTLIGFQIILFFLLKNHIITLPNINY